MINGSAKTRADDKGRLMLPIKFREFLPSDSPFILTLHPHGCLTLYKNERFSEIARQIAEIGNIGFLDAHMEEVIVGCAESVLLDSAGRLLIQNHLRERANIRRNVLLFGMGDCIRVWDEERWTNRNTMALSQLQDREMEEPWRKLRI